VSWIAAGADEIVDRQVQRFRQACERGGVGVDELLHINPGGLRGEHVLERVVVGPGLEPDLLAGAPVVAGEHVGLHELQREAQVWARVDVRDRGGDVGTGHRNLQLDRGSDRAYESRPREQGLGNERPCSVSGPVSGASSG